MYQRRKSLLGAALFSSTSSQSKRRDVFINVLEEINLLVLVFIETKKVKPPLLQPNHKDFWGNNIVDIWVIFYLDKT